MHICRIKPHISCYVAGFAGYSLDLGVYPAKHAG